MAYTPLVWKNSPDTSTPITAENLNRMEDGIETAIVKYRGTAGDNSVIGNYYYDVYEYRINAAEQIKTDPLNPTYAYYIMEGWAKCTSISDDGLTAYFSPQFQYALTGISDSSMVFFENGGPWISIPLFLALGTPEYNNSSGFIGFRKRNHPMDALVNFKAEIWAEENTIETGYHDVQFTLEASVLPTTSSEFVFKQGDVNNLYVYFQIKIDQVRQGSQG